MTASVIARARERLPQVSFLCGDFFELSLPVGAHDVITSLEVLAHVADQAAFVRRLAELLKPDGLLVLSTQNRATYSRWSAVAEADPSQIRQWVDRRALRRLLEPHFRHVQIKSVCPVGDRGFLRIVNAPKLNRLAGALAGAQTVEGWKERAMLGGTLVAIARR
jgi:SAM-dependent methyltransferase